MADKEKKKREKQTKLQTLESTQMWSPIKDVKDGVVLTKDGRYVQILEFAPINFQLRPENEQINIANEFGNSIRIFPEKFHIKILSRKANVEAHVSNLLDHMKHETNAQCRKMQMETIQLIQERGSVGVSKRFFLSFAYEQKAGIRRPKWAEIVESLHQKSMQIVSRLDGDPCNNELISPLGNSEYVLGILYDCMNRAESEIKPLSTKIDDVICTYHVEKRLKSNNATIPLNDVLAPQCIDPTLNFKYVMVDGKYHAYGYIPKNCYPLRCTAGWIGMLINMGEGIDVDIWVEKQATEKVRQSLTRTMNWAQVDYNSKDDSAADIEQIRNKLHAGNYIREKLSSGQEFMYFSIMLSIIADSPEELKNKVEWVQAQLMANDLRLQMVNFRHNEAFRSSLPLCRPDEQIYRKGARNILSGDFGAAYPFTSYEINDREGVLLGYNLANDSPVFINQFDQTLYNNGNMVIFGSPGAGKTYMLQCLALRLRQQGVQTIIIAPYKGHEFKQACKAVGGQFVTIAPGSVENINIMEIRKLDTENNRKLLDGEDAKISLMNTKIQQIHVFFSLLLKDITPTETQELDEALIRAYKRYGITAKNKSLIDPSDPTRYKRMPVLGDLAEELEKSGASAQRLRSVLNRFVTGSAKSFNAPTNVNLDNPYVVIDVSEMRKEMLPIGIFIATDFVSDMVKADRTQKKAIIWDEHHRIIGPAGTPESAEFAANCWKVFRGYRAICIAATQSSTDYLSAKNGDYGKQILDASKLKIVMKVESLDANAIGETLNLGSSEVQEIQYFRRGEALLIANRNHAKIKVIASSHEHRIITTDPKELEQMLKEMELDGDDE